MRTFHTYIQKIHSLKQEYKDKKFFFSSLQSLLFTLSPYIRLGCEYKHKCINQYLQQKFTISLDLPKGKQVTTISDDSPIWILWYQGEDKMPPIVKTCVSSIRRNAGKHKVIFLDETNIHHYITLPQYIIDKKNNGTITLTHYSDIIRMALLSQYGGFWIDATVFITSPITSYSTPFYSIKQYKKYKRFIADGNKWTAFFLAVGKNDPISLYVYKLFLAYWKKENAMIDYFLVDYALNIAFNMFPSIKTAIDNIPCDNNNIYVMKKHLNDTYTPSLWKNLSKQQYNKLSWKILYKQGNTIANYLINLK